MTDQSLPNTWQADGLEFTELIQQPYEGCIFGGGVVDGHDTDTVYIRWERDEETGGMLMLRPDEMAAIAHIAAGVLWSVLVKETEPCH